MRTGELEFDNEFWRFSVAVYATPGVAEECLALQEALGIDVNLLLFCAWLGARRHVILTPSDVAGADTAVRNWHKSVVQPLRGVRTALKSICGDCAGYRSKVKAIELEAEQMEQAMLYAYAREHWPKTRATDAPQSVRENVQTVLIYTARGSASHSEVKMPDRLTEVAISLRH
ncbi:MAG TPA: TIGR02444 family protein [Pseudolabrys sp.]|nr:TIGR02444 family protein [Pseudolabrys sp.]